MRMHAYFSKYLRLKKHKTDKLGLAPGLSPRNRPDGFLNTQTKFYV